MKKSIFVYLLLIAFLSGCAMWVQVGGKYETSSKNFKTELPDGWRRYNLDNSKVLITKDGLSLQWIAISRTPVDEKLAYTQKKFSKQMLAQEAAEVAIDNFRSNPNIFNLSIIENNPAVISGHPGFKIVYKYKTDRGLTKKGVYYCSLVDEWCYNIIYEAPARYYYAKDLSALEKVKDSFKLLKDQISSQGKVVEPKTQPQKVTSAKDIEQGIPATDETQETPKMASVHKDTSVAKITLRRVPRKIPNQSQIKTILKEYDFFDRSWNPNGSFKNVLIDNMDGTATDKATGLMWQRDGSTGKLDRTEAQRYIQHLNEQGFAGYSDWRLPTVDELASLLAKNSQKGVHLAPEFDTKHSSCWTADECDTQYYLASGAWIVNFKKGQIQQGWYKKPSVTANYGITALRNDHNFVKAVRSVKNY